MNARPRRGRAAAGAPVRDGLRRDAVRARFLVREAPGVTVTSPGAGPPGAEGRGPLADAARLGAQRALAEAGRGYLGGCLELRTQGRVRGERAGRALRRAVVRAAALAVAAALRGETTAVHVPAGRHR
ncbi:MULTISPECIES: hypothetical protein [unclassified Streptomyces]|uniref:hypothetical protein n=1 Tax=unclassified Streptomyces TaxID=2593676 RepID=UPI001F53EAA8|nr:MULTISPECIES: hypothetical protein [unclassified Streptomyces]